tara:strand:+ start:3589 stop:4035 length:447 start_codon:yes stop_codon:yes gene_type:complete
MKVNFSDMTQQIAQEVIKVMTPRVRKIVQEEVRKGVRHLLKEQRKLNDQLVESNSYKFDPSANYGAQDANAAKSVIAQRAHSKAKAIYEASDDPMMEMILGAEDPQIEQQIKEQAIISQPMIKSNEVNKGDAILPEMMDFSDRMDKII